VERLRALPAEGIRLRTRALTTTMFARLLLGDLFVHGIGGAKYDELGDEIIRRFFGIEPPPFWTLSLTQRLGLPRREATREQLAEARREIRSLRYNPHRHLGPSASPAARELAEARASILAAPMETRRQRVARYVEIRRLNAALAAEVAGSLESSEAEATELAAGLAWNRLADHREYAWTLHDRARLERALRPWAEGP
jgi:hypothetical protein